MAVLPITENDNANTITAGHLRRGRPSIGTEIYGASPFAKKVECWVIRYDVEHNVVTQLRLASGGKWKLEDGELWFPIRARLTAQAWREALNRFADYLLELGEGDEPDDASMNRYLPWRRSDFLPARFAWTHDSRWHQSEFFSQLTEALELTGMTPDEASLKAKELKTATDAARPDFA